MRGPSQKGLSPDTAISQSQKAIWTVKDLMELTGMAKQTIYNKVNHNEIPYRKKGKRLYFFPNEIINWIDEGDIS